MVVLWAKILNWGNKLTSSSHRHLPASNSSRLLHDSGRGRMKTAEVMDNELRVLVMRCMVMKEMMGPWFLKSLGLRRGWVLVLGSLCQIVVRKTLYGPFSKPSI